MNDKEIREDSKGARSNTKNIHLGASGILSSKGMVLLGRRDKNDPSFPGMWCTPGGGVNFGETVDAAIVREFKEETNLDVRVIGNFQSFQERINQEKNRHTVIIFRQVTMVNSALEPLDGFDAVRWFSKDDFSLSTNVTVTPMTHRALMEYFRFVGS